jgi:hypothetical protein
MAETPVISMVLFLLAAFFGALGQFLYKSGSQLASGGWQSYLFNPRLIGGVACYIAVMVLFVAAFKKGGSMTVLYPLYASTFIWAAVISYFAFGTEIKPVNIGGMIVMGLGMYLMGR